MSLSSNSVPVGYGTVAGVALTVAEIVGGLVLLLAGKTAAEKEAGQMLLSIATPITAGASIHGRMMQAVPVAQKLEPELPAPLRALADEGLRVVQANPPIPDGPGVARSTLDHPEADLPAA